MNLNSFSFRNILQMTEKPGMSTCVHSCFCFSISELGLMEKYNYGP